MKILFSTAPWLILLISFAILALFYDSLPDKILIARSFWSSDAVTAPKSLFTVFRVPLIETVCAAAIEIMRRNFTVVNKKLSISWNILLYTVALKSLFQSLETVSTNKSAELFFYLTVGVVALGLISAIFLGWHFFPESWRTRWNFKLSEKLILVSLLIGYLGLAIIPILVYK